MTKGFPFTKPTTTILRFGVPLPELQLSPIDAACKRDDPDAVEAILRSESEPIASDAARYWLHCAAQDGSVRVVQRIVSLGYSVNSRKHESDLPPEGPLFPAVTSGNVELVRWLLERGATSDCVAEGGVTRNFALGTAIRMGRLDLVRLIVEHGANVNVYYNDSTPLSAALECGHKDIADYLRSKGGKTPEELGVVKPKRGKKK